LGGWPGGHWQTVLVPKSLHHVT